MTTKKRTGVKRKAAKTAKRQAGQSASSRRGDVKQRAGTLRNRIVGYELVDPKTIKRNPLNWRTHPDAQRSAMADSLDTLGVVDACLVNKRTNHLIDGEMRLDIAEERNEPTVPVLFVDLSPEEEKLALATINPMADLAGTDPEQLAELLRGRKPHDGPLDELLRSLEELALEATVKPTPKKRGRSHAAGAVRATTRIVLAVPNIAEFERAIAMTGIVNRGDALLELARTYLKGHDNEEAEDDAASQGELADQLAQALGG